MQVVYNLVMIDMESSYDNHIESFNIGFFSSYAIAEKTAMRYLSEVSGFKDFHVTYQITKKIIINASGSSMPPDVYIIYGWNVNGDLDEIDIIESDCYLCMEEAEKQFHAMKSKTCRDEWCIDRYRIDACYWQEGFEKVYQ